MIISLIGMSNVGKSYWAKKLETEQGFTRVCCDDLIAEELMRCLPEVDVRDMDAFAAWLGNPQEFGYEERERAYLDCEGQALLRAIDKIPLERKGMVRNLVIDTTGSVIYLSESVLKKLAQISTVVYLETTSQQITEMIEKFHAHPKPLIWGQHQSYPDLLAWREKKYQALAQVTIPYDVSHGADFTSDKLLYEVLQHKQSSLSR